jgi:DNA replication factor GINS
MELDELRVILLSERETGRLTAIPVGLYQKTRERIAAMYAEVCAIDDPLSDDARRLIEATQSMRETVQEILTTRARKILTLALVQIEGGRIDSGEAKRMQAEEREMFDLITHALDECRHSLLKGEQGEAELPLEGENMSCGEIETGVPAPEPAPKQGAGDYDLVRVLADVESFLGVDGRVYELKKEDLALLPKRNAEVLRGRNIVLNMNFVK